MAGVHGWWYVVTLAVIGVIAATVFYLRQNRTLPAPAPGSNISDLNRLLQDGSVTPEEYDLLKRRLLAGHVV